VLIKRARIKNFRCLEDAEITFDSVTTFIGPNGVGKSTVLRALDWFFNGGPLTDDDVLQGSPNRWIRVEVEFHQLTVTDREKLTAKYAPMSSETVTVWRTWDDGNDKRTGKALAFRSFEEIRSLEKATPKKAKYNELRQACSELELPAWTNERDVDIAMSEWERLHPEVLTEAEVSDTHFFGFAGQGVISELFDYVLVTADLRASEETQDSKSAILGRILERAINRAAAETQLQELSSRFLEQQSAIHTEHYGPELATLSRELSDAVEAFTRGRSVTIRTVNTEARQQKVQFSVSIQDGLTETRVDRQGHGFQRALIIAALKALADRGASAGEQGVICLAIEEPELFQHPVQARAFASVLRKLAENPQQQTQVTYATHSPCFIDPSHLTEVRRVCRDTNGGGVPTVRIPRVDPDKVIHRLDGFVNEADARRRMGALCIDDLSEALFAEAVMLVEGTTEQAIIEGIAEREGEPLALDGIVVAEVGGKGGLLLPHAILDQLGIPCYLIFDGDAGWEARRRQGARRDADPETLKKLEEDVATAVAKHRADNRKLLRFLGATEEDWPSTGAYARYAVLDDDLEQGLDKIWPAWRESQRKLIKSGDGFPGKHGATYRRAASEAADKAPDVFQEILTAARSIRRSK
jgi:putative ATP-dependent endonuclease of OLD family